MAKPREGARHRAGHEFKRRSPVGDDPHAPSICTSLELDTAPVKRRSPFGDDPDTPATLANLESPSAVVTVSLSS